VAGGAVHIFRMMKKREELDMATIVDAAIADYAEGRLLTGAVPFEKMTPDQLKRMRDVFFPVIWSAIPSILTQLDTAVVSKDEYEEILAGFKVPDTLDGLVQ
jgi:hypothetical protein